MSFTAMLIEGRAYTYRGVRYEVGVNTPCRNDDKAYLETLNFTHLNNTETPLFSFTGSANLAELPITEYQNLYPVEINTQLGTSYSVVGSDIGKLLVFTNANPITVTIPVGLIVGFNLAIIKTGAGVVNITPDSGVNTNGDNAVKSMSSVYKGLSLMSLAQDDYLLGGSLD